MTTKHTAVRSEDAPVYAATQADDAIIAQALGILSGRLQRLGAVGSPRAAAEFARLKIGGLPHEVFGAFWLDTQHNVIAWQELSRGTIDGASVYPREVVKSALDHNAAAVIFAHNHPSGATEPSAADRILTDRLKTALATVEIRTLDHLVVSATGHTSFAERGWL